ncbi:MAG: sigma 54-interacting transcriptional regulator [Acidobacteria bacterium]|nr:sigma 54-interacting transcriptional regulator [Acidobacteriota bacterium]
MDRILVIDPDPHSRTVLESCLTGLGFLVETALTLAQASELAREHSFHLVLTASELSDADALSIIHWAQREQQAAAVVIVVPAGGVDWPRPALRLSDGYLLRSAADVDDLRHIVLNALEQRRALWERDLLRRDCDRRRLDGVLVAVDPLGRRLADELRAMAKDSCAVLLTGESGSLFEPLAQEIHKHSAASGSACHSLVIPAGSALCTLRALFGAEEPGFEIGLLEGARGGTVFMEDIAQLPLPIQEKLLRFLETGSFRRSGGTRRVAARTRVIAASRRDLAARVEVGQFRADLYRHLTTHRIEVPPLRARPLDIVPLAEHFLSNAAERLGRSKPQLSADVARMLAGYSWPGNLQELRLVMERAALLCDQSVRVIDLLSEPAPSGNDASWRQIERLAIEDALRAHAGNRTKAARQLGMSLRKLQYRLRAYGIPRLRPQD